MQRNNFEGHYVASDSKSGHTIPDVIKVAKAYGFKTEDIKTNAELAKKMHKIMKNDEPMLIALHMDPYETVSPRVKAYVGENGQMRSGLLENMWPQI